MIRPIDIARELNISTSLLRHYEKNQLLPLPKRSKSGYRLYTEESLHYFRAIRTTTITYGYHATKKIMTALQKEKFTEAFWLLNEEQVKLNQRKKISDQTLALLHEEEWQEINQMPNRGWLTIGEAAERLAITETSIRHWTKEQLLDVPRDPESNYRMFDEHAIQQLLFIRMIRASTWSLDEVREILTQFQADSPKRMIELAEQSLRALNELLKRQMISTKYIYALIQFLEPDFFEDFPSSDFY
ncbi:MULTISPECIES: MerR family transcriptional regulator [unclassified Enterococcus]|uniref:MerR family transcriptional regulator n=1 Tax=unclassified Enterococcus TaxID=2608891 RepID=UPI001CE05FE0|nr:MULTISPECIES: MerR family transcriptional regulator [unclassified Enterococcus]MCA5013978.1 MerR family transcriptional regulator [Enterococcus sp. S23]MCA5017248.1 MerR family transcriptional regulator [Enterococcus sp. S22(2020)]